MIVFGGKGKMRGFFRVWLCILLWQLIPAWSSSGSESLKLAILPFKVHSAEDLSYLQKGIQDMLASRVVQGGGLRIVDSAAAMPRGDVAALDVSGAASVGKALGVDFVVFGSITKLGEHISLDGDLVDVTKGASSTHLYTEAANLDGVIPQIGQLAQEIRSSALGQPTQPLAKAQPQAPAASAALPQDRIVPEASGLPQNQIVPGASETALPEPPGGYPAPPGGFTGEDTGELFARSDDDALLNKENALNPSFIMSYEADKARRGYVKSPRLNLASIEALATGDTDGDGFLETVIVDEDAIYIYEDVMMEESNRQIIKPAAVFGKILSVDVGDVNKNGVAEIYVTTLEGEPISDFGSDQPGGDRLASQVIEFRDGKYQSIAERLPYFLRVTRSTQEGLVLLGQEKRRFQARDRASDFLAKPFGQINRLNWEDGNLVPGQVVPLKDQVSVLGLAMVDVDHDGVDEYLGYDDRDYLKVYNAQGGVVWVSQEPYGATAKYYIKDFGREFTPNVDLPDPNVWLPSRIITVDLDRDGFDEVIVSHNLQPVRISKRLRFFTKGAIFSLSWDGLDFMENWRTREMKGYVSDFQVSDLDQDGTPELLVGLVQKTGIGGLFKSKANLISFDLRVDKSKGTGKEAPKEASRKEGPLETEIKDQTIDVSQ
jgi:TolB-like protein